uniref:Tetratricopeptide repeat protein 13 n=1 Tax=Knipowitschia caucasica TaxID=637954 RepID=A0AAV2K9K9_KNICA
MAPASRAVVMVVLTVLYLSGTVLSTEYFSTLTLFNSELHKQGCSSLSDWEEYTQDCESSILQLEDPDCEEGSNSPCESIFSLNAEKILKQAKLLIEQKKIPFPVENQNANEELAIGYVLIGNGLFDEAIKHFSILLQSEPELVSAIYGRGIAYGKKSLQDIKNADLALYELNRVITLEPTWPEVYEQRAEILSPLGRISEALTDLTKAISLQPSARLYRHRGTLLFISEDYVAAMEDFQQSLELKRNQPIAMLYKGLTFFHRGLLKEAIETFKEALKLKSDFIDAYKSLGQAYRELGDFESAMESFQKALMLNQNHIQSLQLRGMMLYHHGSLQEAIGNFKRCLQLEPYNEVCQYMKGLSHVAMGQFYEGIKAQTKVMLNDPLLGQKASSEYLKVKYLREYSRYLHSHLDIPVAEYNVDQNLPGNFKNHWAKNLPFLIEDYEEQPGLQPHIKLWRGDCGVETVAWRLWRGDCGVETVAWRLWRGDCGAETVARRLWRGDCGAETVARRLWRGETVARRLWRGDCGAETVARRLWRGDCGAETGAETVARRLRRLRRGDCGGETGAVTVAGRLL